MKKIFIACPISKYIKGNSFTDDKFKDFTEQLYNTCKTYSQDVFLALKREEYGKKLMRESCVKLDLDEMKNTELVIAIPDDSKGTAVELGWASYMNLDIILILDKNKQYTPLISGLNDITKTKIIWYDGDLNKVILKRIEKAIKECV